MNGFDGVNADDILALTGGLCHAEGHDPQMWDTDYPELNSEAVEICNRCPLRGRCLETALRRREQFGVWGGTMPGDRHALLKGAA